MSRKTQSIRNYENEDEDEDNKINNNNYDNDNHQDHQEDPHKDRGGDKITKLRK